MKRICTLLIIFSLFLVCHAQTQTQHGIVKTRGRMVNGQLQRGKGLSGATVNIKGRSAVLSQASGAFSFPLSGKTFMVEGVQKNGYQLVDVDAMRKPYQYSTNTFYILMDTPEQQQSDKLAAERKLRRTLQQQLQKREEEIDAMKVSLEEKNRLLAELYEDQRNNDKLIAEMAQQYATMDYDQMDSLNQIVSDCILNGELQRADSLLRSKGDIHERYAEIDRRMKAEAQEKSELEKRQQNLEASEAGTRQLLDDFADDCLNYHNIFKLENRHDSASFYIEVRAQCDTANAYWQHDAAYYYHEQNEFRRAAVYYNRALNIFEQLSEDEPLFGYEVVITLRNLADVYRNTQEVGLAEVMYKEALKIRNRLANNDTTSLLPLMAGIKNGLANLYFNTNRFVEAETMYKEAIEIRRSYAQADWSKIHEGQAEQHRFVLEYVSSLNSLAALYNATKRYKDAEPMFKEALETYKRFAQDNPGSYEHDVAMTLHNLAHLYSETHRMEDAETLYNEALKIYRRLVKDNPQAYEPDLARTLNALGVLYKITKRFDEAEAMYREAQEIYQRLARHNPLAYEEGVAMTLFNLAILYERTNRNNDAEAMYKKCLDICRRLAIPNRLTYEPKVAEILYLLANLYTNTKQFVDAEPMYKESLDIYRRLTQANPQLYESPLAETLNDLAFLYYKTQRFVDAEPMYKEALVIRQRLAQTNPQVYEPVVAETLYRLAFIYGYTKRYDNAVAKYEEALVIYRRLAKTNPQTYNSIVANILGNQSYYAIFLKQFTESEQFAREGITMDSTMHIIYSNLAAALLFQGKYAAAEAIYRQYKNELKEGFLDDFEQFSEAGVIPEERKEDVEKIKMMLNE